MAGLAAVLSLAGAVAHAGGDPRQVMVVTNADDPDALAIAEHYTATRQLPEGRVCALTGVSPADTTLAWDDYDAVVPDAIDACLAALPDPDAIHLLVTTRGLPYRVDLGAGYMVGFESLLQVHRGRVRSDGSLLAGSPQTDLGGYFAASVENPAFIGRRPSAAGCDFTVSNEYALWYGTACQLLGAGELPEAFDRHGDWDVGAWQLADQLFVVTRLDGFDADDAMDLVDRGLAADESYPTAPLMCMHGADAARGARDPECELVTRRLAEAGLAAAWLDTFDATLSGETVAGYLTGAASMTGAISDNTFVPGALTDNLTSYGAVPNNFFCDETGEVCPASESQTSVARFVRAGATGAHGTVAEPLNNVFPSASLYLLYSFGYSLGESYFFSQRYLYWQNLVLGDPLTTPYATRPTVTAADSVAADGTLRVEADHPDGIAWLGAYRGDRLVAEGSGPALDVDATLLGTEGDGVELYLLAEAEGATLSRPGWETETWQTRAGVRGWAWTEVTITPAEGLPADTGDPEDTGDLEDTAAPTTPDDTGEPEATDDPTPSTDKSGGCATVAPVTAGSMWLLALMAVGRRSAGRRRR